MTVFDELYPFQREAVEWALHRSGAAMFPEQGCGKTYITAALVEQLIRARRFVGLCVVPLANVETTWVRTLARVEGLNVCRDWETFKKTAEPKLLLLHYEAFRGNLVKRIVKRHWTLVAFDESQRLKARGSQASRAAARFRDVAHRVILSGTPIEQAPQDLWAQFRFALPDVLGTKWTRFKQLWLYETGFMGYKVKFRPEMMPRFLEKVHPHIYRVTAREALNLPPLKFKRWTVEMMGDQRRVYREVTRDMMATVGDRTVTCALAITQLIRQQQIAGGFVRVDPSPAELELAAREERRPRAPVVRLGGAKIRCLKRILRRVELPVVVFCKYKWEVRAIARACERLRVGFVTGGRRKTRVATIDAFQAGELDALVCQIKAGGVGINLFRACEAVFYSYTFSSIDFYQAVKRLHRNGQTRAVTIHLIQAAFTVDKRIWSRLIAKKSVVENILDRTSRRR